jgi:hypothetical protein
MIVLKEIADGKERIVVTATTESEMIDRLVALLTEFFEMEDGIKYMIERREE